MKPIEFIFALGGYKSALNVCLIARANCCPYFTLYSVSNVVKGSLSHTNGGKSTVLIEDLWDFIYIRRHAILDAGVGKEVVLIK